MKNTNMNKTTVTSTRINSSPGSTDGGIASVNGQVNSDQAPPPPMNMNDILTAKPLQSDLTEAEKHQLKELETVVKKSLALNREAAKALNQIRDKRLYRDKYKTFEEYCRKVWDYSKTHVNRQIGAAQVIDILTPVGVSIESESVARPLVGLEDQQIVAAMTEA